MSVRESFAAEFGEDEAQRVRAAALCHEESHIEHSRGSDPFKYYICICIGFQCLSNDDYRKSHGIVASWERLSKWIKEHGELATHDGSFDYIAAVAGRYNEFLPEPPEEATCRT